MATFKAAKVVGALPTPLVANTLYAVRVGAGFDLYCSDATGSVAHVLNMPGAESRVDLGAGANIDVSAANLFTKTISANTTLTLSNVPAQAGVLTSFILELENGGSADVTFWPGIKWPFNSVPDLTVDGVDVLGFYTYDAGASWMGLYLSMGVV